MSLAEGLLRRTTARLALGAAACRCAAVRLAATLPCSVALDLCFDMDEACCPIAAPLWIRSYSMGKALSGPGAFVPMEMLSRNERREEGEA